jgi:hypothetical protein
MSDGKHCPVCGKDIGIWPIVAAGLPYRIWCPHCATKLHFVKSLDVMLVLLVLIVTVVGGAYFVWWEVFASQFAVGALVFAALCLGPWVPLELAAALFLRSRRNLARVGSSQK